MSNIKYTITGGTPDITVSLFQGETLIDTNVHTSVPVTGSFTVDSLLSYTIQIIDSSEIPCVVYKYIEPCEDCPDGYTPIGNICVKYEEEPSTEYLPFETVVPRVDYSYTNFGTLIFDSFNMDGTGTFEAINPINTYWNNKAVNTSDGPMNRSAVWAGNVRDHQDIKFAFCVDILETKTYYVGIGCDNWGKIYLNGIKQLEQDRVALAAMLGKTGTENADRVPHKYWYIYPMLLQAGKNVLEIYGHNELSVAGVGIEIYDATKAELMAATSDSDLENKLLFRSKDLVGEDIIYETSPSDGPHGYECPPGSYLDVCNEGNNCIKSIQLPCSSEDNIYNNPGIGGEYELIIDRVTSGDCNSISISLHDEIFPFTDIEDDSLVSVKILDIPSIGYFTKGVSDVLKSGDILDISTLLSGLYYYSNDNISDAYTDTLTYQVLTENSIYGTVGVITINVTPCSSCGNDKKGLLYNIAAIDTDKIANTGWHIPSASEFSALKVYLAITAGYNINEVGLALKKQTGWNGVGGGDGTYGFNAIPCGTYVGSSNTFSSILDLVFYGTSDNGYYALADTHNQFLSGTDSGLGRGYTLKLLKDDSTWTLGDTYTGNDGKVYNTCKIGTQVWTVEPLEETEYNDASPIQHLTTDTNWLATDGCTPYNHDLNYLCQDPDPIEYINYHPVNRGGFYNGYALADGRGLPASGWHVGTEAEWDNIITYCGTSYNDYLLGGTNIYGLNFQHFGHRSSVDGAWVNVGVRSYSGTLSTPGASYTVVFYVYPPSPGTSHFSNTKYSGGFNVRLICDTPATGIPDGTEGLYVGNDGKNYKTVAVNEQWILANNLAETKYANGDWITGYDGGIYTPIANATWSTLTTGALCAYNDDESNL